MYSMKAGFGQTTGLVGTLPLLQTGTGTPVPAATQAQSRATISLMQMSLNRPPPNGVNAGITPFTYVFDAKTENALKQWLRSKGASDQIVPGMWTNIVKAGLGEAGAKQWEAAIAYHKKWTGAPKTTTPKLFLAKTPISKMSVAKLPVQQTSIKPLGPAPLPGAAEECARKGGNFKLINNRWTCLMPVQPAALAPAAAPTPTPVTPTPVQQKTFVTYPAPDSGVAPLGPAPMYPPGALTPEQQMMLMKGEIPFPEALKEEKKGLPVWGWILIGLGGAAVLGGGIWLGLRAKRGG
jgi:hypothetical protein